MQSIKLHIYKVPLRSPYIFKSIRDMDSPNQYVILVSYKVSSKKRMLEHHSFKLKSLLHDWAVWFLSSNDNSPKLVNSGTHLWSQLLRRLGRAGGSFEPTHSRPANIIKPHSKQTNHNVSIFSLYNIY